MPAGAITLTNIHSHQIKVDSKNRVIKDPKIKSVCTRIFGCLALLTPCHWCCHTKGPLTLKQELEAISSHPKHTSWTTSKGKILEAVQASDYKNYKRIL